MRRMSPSRYPSSRRAQIAPLQQGRPQSTVLRSKPRQLLLSRKKHDESAPFFSPASRGEGRGKGRQLAWYWLT